MLVKGIPCHMKIIFEELIIYDIRDYFLKDINISFTIMTGNGIETFETPNYKVKDNLTVLNFS